jgi:class 3 adenylate cyclase
VRRLGDGYATVLADHRRLFRAAVESCAGLVIDHRGDEFFVVFEDAGRAVEAVSEAQRALAAHPWPEGVEMRVRMGLHTGEPTMRDGDYYGLDVHRAARIAQAGSGGQVLLSERTKNALDASHELADLGEHELAGVEDAPMASLYGLAPRSIPTVRTTAEEQARKIVRLSRPKGKAGQRKKSRR